MEEIEFDIIEECYFVIGYEDLKQEVMQEDQVLQKGLVALLQKGHLQQMYFDRDAGDYIKKEEVDLAHLADYSYLASKEGLLAHNT